MNCIIIGNKPLEINLDKVIDRMDYLLSNFQFTSFERFIQNNFKFNSNI